MEGLLGASEVNLAFTTFITAKHELTKKLFSNNRRRVCGKSCTNESTFFRKWISKTLFEMPIQSFYCSGGKLDATGC
jgi:hypothetical protein